METLLLGFEFPEERTDRLYLGNPVATTVQDDIKLSETCFFPKSTNVTVKWDESDDNPKCMIESSYGSDFPDVIGVYEQWKVVWYYAADDYDFDLGDPIKEAEVKAQKPAEYHLVNAFFKVRVAIRETRRKYFSALKESQDYVPFIEFNGKKSLNIYIFPNYEELEDQKPENNNIYKVPIKKWLADIPGNFERAIYGRGIDGWKTRNKKLQFQTFILKGNNYESKKGESISVKTILATFNQLKKEKTSL